MLNEELKYSIYLLKINIIDIYLSISSLNDILK